MNFSKLGLSLHGLYKIKLACGIQTSSQEEGVTMSVFLQMSIAGVGDHPVGTPLHTVHAHSMRGRMTAV